LNTPLIQIKNNNDTLCLSRNKYCNQNSLEVYMSCATYFSRTVVEENKNGGRV